MLKLRKKRLIIILVITIITVLVIYNPSPETFRKSLPILTNLPNIVFSSTNYSKYSVYGRKINFLVCSIYQFQFDAKDEKNKPVTIKLEVLGIAGNFIIIKKEG